MRALFRTSDRSAANATLAVAFALTLTAVCVAPEARAGAVVRSTDVRPRLVDDQAARIVVAAVNAARDLFGLDHTAVVLIVPGQAAMLVPPIVAGTRPSSSQTRPPGLPPLLPAFIDLPPPTC